MTAGPHSNSRIIAVEQVPPRPVSYERRIVDRGYDASAEESPERCPLRRWDCCLVRSADRASRVDPRAEAVVGQLTDAKLLGDAVAGIDPVIFTHSDNSNPEAVNYGAVRNVLQARDGRRVQIALMTAIGVTSLRDSSMWKRRGEGVFNVPL